jgi:spermidine synthase
MVATPARRARDLALAALPVAAWIAVPFALRTRIPQDFLGQNGALIAFREGLTSNVAVVRTGEALQLEIDRWWQGQDTKTHQIMAAHVPMLLHPDPRSVLVVGAGTGQTASRFLLHPIERLDVVDIEPAVFDVVRAHFDRRWLEDPRTHVILEDGRNHVAHAGVLYDIVSLEVGQVFRPGVASFYTAEFYQRARRRLAPGGLVCQFVPLPFLTPEQFRGVVGTFLDAFPTATLWYNTSELLLIGTTGDSLALRDDRVALLSANAGIHDDLQYSPWGGPAEWLNRPTTFLGGYLCGRTGLEALARGAPRYRDDRPVLEYATSGADESRAPEIEILATLRGHLDSLATALAAPWPADSLAASRAMREANLSDIAASARLRPVTSLAAAGAQDRILEVLTETLRLNPRSVQAHRLMGDALVAYRRWPEAREHYETALRLRPGDPVALRGLATWHLSQQQLDQARPLFETLLAVAPGDAEAHNNYGVLLIGAGDVPGAITQFREALRLRPGYPDALRNLGRAEWGRPSSP